MRRFGDHTIRRAISIPGGPLFHRISLLPRGGPVYRLCKEDVMETLRPSSFIRADEPPDVVFGTLRPDQYEQVILKANAQGEIVRVRDVANF